MNIVEFYKFLWAFSWGFYPSSILGYSYYAVTAPTVEQGMIEIALVLFNLLCFAFVAAEHRWVSQSFKL